MSNRRMGRRLGEGLINASLMLTTSGGTVTLVKSENVSSITDGGVGVYAANFTTALASANYSAAGSAMNSDASNPGFSINEDYNTRSTTVFPFTCTYYSGSAVSTLYDPGRISVIFTGA